ncbi:DUF4183 domain-containing protein [Falsibacillus pallidus]|uniref:Uncharacterized protein DUF4183 n=1 Tax=Falsibacillus pallidus TaxID=493781 RepID=A0A370GZC0_9BACI|nr:DUF4183 domain-containing protein [Falsibacillus pallidus]RDI48004.1 uncharacterized protein DUF4183 [Falsibacillus pallidus]
MNNRKKSHIVRTKKVYDWVQMGTKIQAKINIVQNPDPVDPLKGATYQYNALSDGMKKIYTNEDELTQYGDRGILDPATATYINLFINGVLQPPSLFTVEPGKLTLNIETAPQEGVPIILQYITIFP